MKIGYRKAVKGDIQLLIEINNKSYYDDFVRFGECPGYNVSPQKMDESLENKEIEKHIVYADDKPIGAVSVHNEGEGKYYLGNLCIIPEYQHKGIGKMSIDFVLEKYKDLKELSLVTPAEKVENVGFYTKKCGFKITGEEMDGNVKVFIFKLSR